MAEGGNDPEHARGMFPVLVQQDVRGHARRKTARVRLPAAQAHASAN